MAYDSLIQRLEYEVVWEAEVGAVLAEAAEALRVLTARVADLEDTIRKHRAFSLSRDDAFRANDSRLWAVLAERGE